MNLYNSLTKKVEELIPLSKNEIKMYVCGITPYDTTHLGHAFTYIQFDALKRYLTFKGYKVTYTQNVTDIDDDILKRAKRDGKDWKELVQFWTDQFLTDLKGLNIELPDHYVKATDYIAEIVKIVKLLVAKKHAYEKNGNVYFDVATFPEYGQLSGFTPDQMKFIMVERGADPNDPNKKNPLDFILWTSSSEDQPGWESPWGRGRPGWHIECSAMVEATLGDQIDIHGGGRDLVYPHHESEIAQSESYTGKNPYVKTWMHTAMVQYQGEKMSKSLGNLVLVSELLEQDFRGDQIRWMLLSHHYRSPWEFNEEDIKKMHEYYSFGLHLSVVTSEHRGSWTESDKYLVIKDNPVFKKMINMLEEDFNTPAILEEIKIIMDKYTNNPNNTFENIEEDILAIVGILKILGFKEFQYPHFS